MDGCRFGLIEYIHEVLRFSFWVGFSLIHVDENFVRMKSSAERSSKCCTEHFCWKKTLNLLEA